MRRKLVRVQKLLEACLHLHVLLGLELRAVDQHQYSRLLFLQQWFLVARAAPCFVNSVAAVMMDLDVRDSG